MKRRRLRGVFAIGVASLFASAALANAEVVQRDHVRLSVGGEMTPKTLPRSGKAPIAVEVNGHIRTTDGSSVPQLKTMTVELNREGQIDSAGLPVCPYEALEPASSSRALSACRRALVGDGSFEAEIALPGQPSYRAKGRLLAFNGSRNGKPVLFAHIYSAYPFATSFVIVFAIEQKKRGSYGIELVASLPKALRRWGTLTGIDLQLSRRYSFGGRTHSYLSAGCPAPPGLSGAVFPLVRASFAFSGGPTLATTLTRSCKARGK